MNAALTIDTVRKVYASGHEALKGVSLSVAPGEFFGLLGPNGAGKSTLINILSGITSLTSGSARINGHDIVNEAMTTKRLLGVVPQELSFDHFFSVEETLEYQSGYFGIRNNAAHIDELLTALNLADKRSTNTRALSGGMKRRLLVAKAMVHKPSVLILDEPTAGVDVELRQNLYTYIRKINAAGVTVLLTTHYLEEAEALCDRIAIMNKGAIVALDTTKNLLANLGKKRRLVITTKHPISVMPAALSPFEPVFDHATQQLTLHFDALEYERVFDALSTSKIPVTYFKVVEEDLEDIFIKLTGTNHAQ